MANERSPWSEEFLDELRSWLFRELNGRGPLPVPREDIVGEVLVRFLVASATQAIEHPFAYARVILVNVIRDHIRKLKSWQEVLAGMAGQVKNQSEDLPAVENGELVNYLLENSTLSPIQEKVIRMIYLEGMTTSQVAQELSKNPGTIQQHKDRGLGKLAQCAAKLGVCR